MGNAASSYRKALKQPSTLRTASLTRKAPEQSHY